MYLGGALSATNQYQAFGICEPLVLAKLAAIVTFAQNPNCGPGSSILLGINTDQDLEICAIAEALKISKVGNDHRGLIDRSRVIDSNAVGQLPTNFQIV
jgi:hypothetical protein